MGIIFTKGDVVVTSFDKLASPVDADILADVFQNNWLDEATDAKGNYHPVEVCVGPVTYTIKHKPQFNS